MQSNFIQGTFYPINKEKFMGPSSCQYRSSYELKFFRWADTNPNIIKWGSENIIIPYINPLDNKVHRYFVDNYVIFKDNEGNHKKLLIEIKPSSQTVKPNENRRKKKSTRYYEQVAWVTNQSKWEAAKKWAEKHGAIFTLLTEKDLFK